MRFVWTVMVLIAAQGITKGQGYQQIQELRTQARAAYDREMAREKAGDCSGTATTYAMNTCLGKEGETSSENYGAFTRAIRSMLPSSGQKQFEQVQAAWEQYSHAQCSAASDLYKGGTIATSTGLSCDLLLLRSHMRELAAVYYGTLNY